LNAVEALPASWYTEPAVLALEHERVFGKHWQYVGDASLVSGPNSFMTGRLGALPIVVTRDDAGALRGMVNVCRHRGAAVAEGCGSRRTLQCRYHGWTYRLDGTLHRATKMDVPDGIRLPQISVGTIGNLLFACAVDHAPELEDVLAPFLQQTREVAGVDVARLELRQSVDHDIRANWKAVVENFVECYHCPLIHSATLPGYGGEGYDVEIQELTQTQHMESDRFNFLFLFPNTQVSVYGNSSALIARALHPVDAQRTNLRLDYWFHSDVSPEVEKELVDWFETVVGEDLPLCESVQVGVSSGGFERGYLHPQEEAGPWHFQRLLTDALRD
jgi:phenylpropionate dioxygenase-like ring-hydroxylating dioxygenase large terminal subunit